MFTVALIGADGAGKSTTARKIIETFPLPIKYLYMGSNMQSSNVALPTSRLIFLLRLYLYKRSIQVSQNPQPDSIIASQLGHQVDKRGKVGAAGRLLYRLTEEWFRQIISWSYQLRDYIVLYDRHFIFDYAKSNDAQKQKLRLTDRLHWWLLNHFYPRPDLVIFLDAPPEILFDRKGEATLDYLRGRREAFIAQGKKTANFIQVDASQPFDKVFAEVTRHIMQFHSVKNPQKIHGRS